MLHQGNSDTDVQMRTTQNRSVWWASLFTPTTLGGGFLFSFVFLVCLMGIMRTTFYYSRGHPSAPHWSLFPMAMLFDFMVSPTKGTRNCSPNGPPIKTRTQFYPTLGNSQPPVAPAPRVPSPSSGLHGPLHSHTQAHIQMHTIHTDLNIFTNSHCLPTSSLHLLILTLATDQEGRRGESQFRA